MARGYPGTPSVVPGNTLMVHFASDALKIRFDFFRQGAQLVFTGSSPWYDGPAPQGNPTADQDFGWNGVSFGVPQQWQSGVYIAAIVEWDGQGNEPPIVTPASTFSTDGMLLFILRSATPGAAATILYKLSLNTYHAYNITGGGAFYVQGIPSQPPDPPGGKVTLLRPGAGTGGDLAFPGPDPYDPNSHPQSFSYWDAPFIAWLESVGYAVDYCTDWDIHRDWQFLHKYRLLLSVGHDEYWSQEMRSNIESFLACGGNVAFLSGNTCWWRVHFVDNDTAMVCLKGIVGADDQWWNGFAKNPENSVTGVSYRNAGGWWGSKRERVPYQLQNTDNWALDQVGEASLQVQDPNVAPLVGYECDGAQFDYDNIGRAVPTHADGTPDSFQILGLGILTQLGDGNTGWSQELREFPGGTRAATMGVYANNGTVFTGATVEWPRVVAAGTEPGVTRITGNVLDTLSSLELVDVTAITGQSVAGPLTSWQTADGPYLVEHLAGVDSVGNVWVFFWSPRADWQAVNVSEITAQTLTPGTQLTSWQTPDGPYNVEHLAGVDSNGNLFVFFWSPRADWQAVNVSQISGRSLVPGAPVTSWQTPDGPYNVEHLAGVDSNGNLFVFFWSPRADWQAVNISQISGQSLVPGAPVTSWQTPDGPYNVEHLAGVNSNGNLFVFFWSPRADWQAVNVSQISGQSLVPGAPVTSWQTPDGPYNVEHLAGVDSNGSLFVFFWSPRADWQAVNASGISGQPLAGGLSSWQVWRGGLLGPLLVEKVVGFANDGSVQVLSWSPAHDWSAFSPSVYTAAKVNTPPTSWQVPDGPQLAEHVAATTPDGRLVVIYWESPA
jgi:hypothetical protein